MREGTGREMGVVSLTVVVKAVEDIHCCFLLLWTVEWMTAWMTLDHLHLVDQVVDVRGVVVSESDGLEVAKELLLECGVEGGCGGVVGEGDDDDTPLVVAALTMEAALTESVASVCWQPVTKASRVLGSCFAGSLASRAIRKMLFSMALWWCVLYPPTPMYVKGQRPPADPLEISLC